jgi:4-nitrophenyl phosphatase
MTDSDRGAKWPRVAGVISDLDGVVYRGNEAIADAVKAFRRWHERAVPYCFVTNNSTYTREQVAGKLRGFGLAVDADRVVTSAVAAAQIVRERHGAGARVFVVGEAALKQAIGEAGLEVTDEAPAVVLVGLDREVTYRTLRMAVRAVRSGAVLIGTNPDPLLPVPDGFDPGAGSILAAVATATGVTPMIVGKPEPHMVLAALRYLGTPREATLMIGDQVSTDIVAGKRAGLVSVLVRTGVPARPDPSLPAPDFSVASLLDIPCAG